MPDSITRPFARPSIRSSLTAGGHLKLASVPDGLVGKALTEIAAVARGRVVFVARDGQRLAEVERTIRFFAPSIDVIEFPAWDCLPYDRASPHSAVVARRMAALSALSHSVDGPTIVLTTVNAVLQKVPSRDFVTGGSMALAVGNTVRMEVIVRWLEDNGFLRSQTVREPGEYAVRGGIVDLFVAGAGEPVRLDFFGDTLETIRTFDADTQRTVSSRRRIELVPANEMQLSAESIARFRERYVAHFGAADRDDLLYQSASEGRRYVGMEHWLPLFADGLETLFDHTGAAVVAFDHLVDEAAAERRDQIADHYQARQQAIETGSVGGVPYHALPPDSLYLTTQEWAEALAANTQVRLSPFSQPPDGGVIDLEGRRGRNFSAERTANDVNVFDAVATHIKTSIEAERRVVVACWSDGSRDRMGQVLADHGLLRLQPVADWVEAANLPASTIGLAVFGIEEGFEGPGLTIVGEQDILGDRLIRPQRKRRAADYLTDATSLAAGDLIVHADHGIGRFVGLKTIEAAGAPHDCLELHYAGNDRVYLPVENIELLSRYGSDQADAPLDKLGGIAWQSRKARLKKRIRDMAEALMKVAAERALRSAPVMTPPDGAYDEFSARFPFDETEDQGTAIAAVLDDLATGRPMDRLICGDVGFGKTEVALRAAFIAALTGRQIAVVVPTTLLARQHFGTFSERFAGLPVRVAQASRLVGAKELAAVKAGLTDGSIDIVIGTHALLGKAIKFRDLGLLIVDEEQHFGVKHKEQLKALKANVHVLTLSATPIPRTLQLALTGVRELSLITTAPVDRLAIRTFIAPFDGLVVREALLRERYRGGQSFYVCPRISDLAEQAAFLAETVPEVKLAIAHGQIPPGELEDIMTAFYDGAYDVLLSTSIVESGLDIPTANTLIVHRSDMFGLAQLYQLRGRVGRSKQRAYALFTVPAERTLTPTAERRLKVLQSLDTLGAGFQLASHDLDIRGAGNLLGEEQSGHIREVGYELYQQMLEEAVASLKTGDVVEEGEWSPQITIGTAVMIPEAYVPDLQLRLGLYRRLADLREQAEIESFAAELIDRFGTLPDEVVHLLELVAIKALCRRANVEKVDAGPKGAVIAFRDNVFGNPAGLLQWIAGEGTLAKVRPDQRVVVSREWADPERRLKGVASTLIILAKIAEEGEKAAA
ncbi:MAG: transcription-repair coupling factor [Hyphomicrobiales bacterium]|nr:transcription-repair coupling factor [Hyphomicrobiales bacterium]